MVARLISQIAARFGIVVSEKVAAQAAPILGAIGGAAVNAAFADHFQTLARGHFIVRRLERQHGAGVVAFEYQRLQGERVRLRGGAKGCVVKRERSRAPSGNWIAPMAENRPPLQPPPQQTRPQTGGALAFALFSLLALPSYANLRPRARSRGAPPMRFVRVVSADAACKPNCPEWLSAEGRIEPGTAKAFADAIANLKGRRLPILIHSPGGSVADAGAMGELIRAKGLAVAVARTLIANCPEASPKCPDGPGTAITGGATCASACVLVLAGGVERLVAPSALIGVHQITTLVSETEGLAHLKSTRKFYEQRGVDAAVEAYLTAMGVGDPVMGLMRKTWASSIRWLSLAELEDSHLATLALDAAEPILTSGANGLNGHAFDGDPPRSDLVQASAVQRSPEAAQRSRSRSAIAPAAAQSKWRRSIALSMRRRRQIGPSSDSSLSDGGREAAAVEDHRRDARSHPHPARALLRPRSWPRDHRFHAARTSARLRAD